VRSEASFVGFSGLLAGTVVGAALGLLLVDVLKPLFILRRLSPSEVLREQ
jgi:hypothetical protein